MILLIVLAIRLMVYVAYGLTLLLVAVIVGAFHVTVAVVAALNDAWGRRQARVAAGPAKPKPAVKQTPPTWVPRTNGDLTQRISDVERHEIAAVLSQHAAEGRLTMKELDDRLAVIYAGGATRKEARSVMTGLPAPVPTN